MKKCRHCGEAHVSRPRGLCWGCFQQVETRRCYPVDARPPVIPDGFGRFPPPPRPTAALPGSPEKIEVLHWRAKARFQLWHPQDAKIAD